MEQRALIPEIIADDVKLDSLGHVNHGVPNRGRGRPKGAKSSQSYALLDRIARSYDVPLIEKLISDALDGDKFAMKIIMDRIWVAPKSAPIAIDMPATETPADLRQAMHDLLGRVTRGEVPTDDGQAIIGMMRDMIDAYRVDVVTPNANAGIDQGSARDLLAERLARVMEARRVQASEGSTDDAEPAA